MSEREVDLLLTQLRSELTLQKGAIDEILYEKLSSDSLQNLEVRKSNVTRLIAQIKELGFPNVEIVRIQLENMGTKTSQRAFLSHLIDDGNLSFDDAHILKNDFDL